MKKRLKKFQVAGLFSKEPSSYDWYRMNQSQNQPSVEITGMGNSEDNSTNPKESMQSLPMMNYSLQNNSPVDMKATPLDINKSLTDLNTSMKPKTNAYGFDLQKYMQMNFLNNAVGSFTSGIEDRRVKRNMIEDRASNVNFTPLGSETSRYGYGYGKRGGLMKMAKGGMINFMFNDDNQESNDEDDYDESSINVEDRERLSEQEVQAAVEQEQAQVDMLRKQQRMEYLRKIINRSRQNNLNSSSYDDSENYDVDIPENQSEQFEIIKRAANKYGVPASILAGVYGAETGFGKHKTMVSSTGAQGPFQFMPGTAKQFGINPWNFSEAADGAARYLSEEYNRFGNWSQAVAAYNAGAGNIQKGIMPAETRSYVPKVMSIANKFSQQGFQQGGVMKQYQRGSQVNAPIYTTDKNKVKNYTDSLKLYNKGEKDYQNYLKMHASEPNIITKYWDNPVKDNDAIQPIKGYGFSMPFSEWDRTGFPQSTFRYKKPVQPYILQKEPNVPFLKSPQMGINKTSVNMQGVPVNIPKLNYEYQTEWEPRVYETPSFRKEWKEPVQKINNMYYKKGGVNTTGYTPGYDTFENDFNIIPSTDITMKETPFDVIGIDKSGLMQYMRPGGSYQFMTPPVLEIPVYKMKNRGKNKQMGGHMGANMKFPVYSQNKNDSYIDSLKPYKRGDVYYVDTATLANLKTANINFKHI